MKTTQGAAHNHIMSTTQVPHPRIEPKTFRGDMQLFYYSATKTDTSKGLNLYWYIFYIFNSHLVEIESDPQTFILIIHYIFKHALCMVNIDIIITSLSGGRFFCLIFGIIGIPFMLSVLANIGSLMAEAKLSQDFSEVFGKERLAHKHNHQLSDDVYLQCQQSFHHLMFKS